MSEVHKHEQAAVSPGITLDRDDTGTWNIFLACFCLLLVFCCVCVSAFLCVASGVKRGSPTFAHGSCEKHSFILGHRFSSV